MKILKEAVDYNSFDIHIYEDSTTGNQFVYKNGRLIPIPKPDTSDEDEEREKEIEREYEEAKKRGIDIQRETPEEREARIKRIQDIFSDEREAKAFRQEAGSKVKRPQPSMKDRQRVNKASKARPISDFAPSIKRFIKKQCGEVKEYSYHRLNKKYAHTNMIKPGKRIGEGHVPLLCVYLDRSGSWTARDTAIAERVIDSLSGYVKKKLLKIQIKEFASAVRTLGEIDPATGREKYIGSGTSGTNVIQDIIDVKPDNVVIMTDGDCSRQEFDKVTVPGGVWLIFKQTESYKDYPENVWVNPAYINSVMGRKLSEVFKIPWGEDEN